jgi:transposase
VFHFTPKHASWLNQVEIWFSILVRKLMRRGSFASKHTLKTAIERFIAYCNATMATPSRWTYTGKPLAL